MVFGPFVDVWHHVVALKPGFLSKTPHFNFITVHYFWIIGLAIICSILLYPVKNMDYIDALFFSSGACTQAGLNTIDVNLLNTYQQVVLFFIPMLTNPITINTFVVFLRLYWFEKRFQHIAVEARKSRRTISKTRSQMKSDRDLGEEEAGVNGRKIVVMHHTTRANGMTDASGGEGPDGIHMVKPDFAGQNANGNTSGASEDGSKGDSTGTDDPQGDTQTMRALSPDGDDRGKKGVTYPYEDGPGGTPTTHQPQIKFAEQVTRSDGVSDEPLRRLPQWSGQDHITVLERQRNPQDREVLRIPGPRDAERGISPETVEADEALNQMISRRNSTLASRRGSGPDVPVREPKDGGRITGDDQPPQRAITGDEPQRHVSEDTEERARAMAHTLGIFRLRKPRIFTGSKTHEEESYHLPRARSRANSFSSFRRSTSQEGPEAMPYLSWQPTVGRNSAFVDLTESQREELGGIEYRSLKSLALILVLYFWGFTIFGFICLIPWIIQQDTWGLIIDADGINRTWWALFSTTTAFNDVGFTLTPDSMISFQTAIWPLLVMAFLIIIGNTGFPVMLRWIIWVTSKYVPAGSGFWEELKFLLDHPRRCFTLLFPSKATWWLFWILVILNGIDLLFFIILDLGNTVVTQLPVNIRILDGFFQAVSTRTAGLTCVNLSLLHPAIQVSYLIMMYISVLPIAISVRRTNVYEERSLGIYGSQDEDKEDNGEPSYVGAHLRRQLSFDLWYIFLGFFVVAISEGPRLQSGDPNFTMFTVLFEIVSAYGTVGLSLGYPTINASFSAEFGVIAKLVIIAMQIRGRHRGLPYELDRAILLPNESMHEKEDADAAARLRRRGSAVAVPGASTELNLNNSGGTHGIGQSRSRKRQQPSFLSRMMHPGPVVSREMHKHGRRSSPRNRDEMMMSTANGSDKQSHELQGEKRPSV